ncbi:hypothetical protein M407DRAFT_18198 [Tulasnella calospora MUT 4182]|uniref:CBM1 domain-containing protein n=1 Tax=Tulasnella calospora MUT 4182 TaxID=1051891 RepID=A0A0C3QTX5_9AGAM|nr:hypothetical protein M407DRAFT_18198 [Tulasnella calospora MUT 4182]
MQLKISIIFGLFMSSAQFVLAQDSTCSGIYAQCGGIPGVFTGPTCCYDATRELKCEYINTQYSVCVPTGP